MRAGGGDLLLAAVVIGLGLLLQWEVRVGSDVAEARPMFAWHLLEGASWAAVLALVLLVPTRTALVLRGRVLGYLGVLSYSIYMWHVPVLRYGLYDPRLLRLHAGLGWGLRNAVYVAGLTLLCLGISELTYRFIELPFLWRKARLADGLAEPLAQAS